LDRLIFSELRETVSQDAQTSIMEAAESDLNFQHWFTWMCQCDELPVYRGTFRVFDYQYHLFEVEGVQSSLPTVLYPEKKPQAVSVAGL